MALTGGFTGNFNSASNFVRNPFSSSVRPSQDGPDFPEGMLIEELLSDGTIGESIRLVGNLMPKDKFPFGGTQRVKKEYYAGFPEPSMQVLGPEESDVTINGEFKDKRYSDAALKGAALEISNLLDGIRFRGNLVRVVLGEWQRYAIITTSKFDLRLVTKIEYSLTFSIIGSEFPSNAIFIQGNKEYPFAVNKELIEAALAFQAANDNIPDSVPLSIADAINGAVSDVMNVVASVTNFVDSISNTVEEIRNSANRVKGIIKYAQNKVRNYKNLVGGFNAFNTEQALTKRYDNAAYYSRIMSQSTTLVALLQKLRNQFANLANDLPQARHLVKEGETLQNLSLKYYGTAENWKRIYDFNNMNTTVLTAGTLLNIPRVT